MIIGSIYRPQNTSSKGFLNQYKQMIELIKNGNRKKLY